MERAKSELKECPFCGKAAKIWEQHHEDEVYYSVTCTNCDVGWLMGETVDKQTIVNRWNKRASQCGLLGDVASKEIAGIERWHWNEPIPKPFDVLAVLRSKSGSIVWSKVSSIFPIDDNWTVVCWTFVNPNIVIESGATKSGNVA